MPFRLIETYCKLFPHPYACYFFNVITLKRIIKLIFFIQVGVAASSAVHEAPNKKRPGRKVTEIAKLKLKLKYYKS